jgi:hypothetical protein
LIEAQENAQPALRRKQMRLYHATMSAMGILLVGLPVSAAQTKSPQRTPSAAERLGLTCTQILAMSSSDWVAKFNQEKSSSTEGTVRAAAVYGHCYDARTDALAESLSRKGAGPSKRARADFVGFETALKDFVAKAVADAQATPDATKIAYIDLYEKQFPRWFYTPYAEGNLKPTLTAEESDQFTKAKNRFGELLGLLPEDKAREVHEAFGEIVGTHEVSLPMKLALYRYTIFILEPRTEKPFSPPPF